MVRQNGEKIEMMANLIKSVTFYISFLILLPMASYAGQACSGSVSAEKISQIVSDNLNEWEGRIRLLDWITEKHPVNDSSTPVFFPSIPDAIEMQKGKMGEPIVLEKAFQVHTITLDKIRNYKGENDFLSLTDFTDTWFVPAFIGRKPVFIIEVGCIENQLKIMSVGAKPLAEALAYFESSKKLTSFKKQRFVRINQPMGDFVATEQDQGEVIYPLAFFTEQYLALQPVDEEGGYRPADVMKVLSSDLPKEVN